MMSFYSQILVHVQLYPRPVPSTEFLPFSTGKLPPLPEKEAPEELEWKLWWHPWILVEPWDQWLYSQGSYHRRNISWNGFHQDKGSTNVPHPRSPYGDGTIVQVRAFHSEGKIFQNTVPKELCVASFFKPSGKNVNGKPKRIKFITEELQDVLEMDVKKTFPQHQWGLHVYSQVGCDSVVVGVH